MASNHAPPRGSVDHATIFSYFNISNSMHQKVHKAASVSCPPCITKLYTEPFETKCKIERIYRENTLSTRCSSTSRSCCTLDVRSMQPDPPPVALALESILEDGTTVTRIRPKSNSCKRTRVRVQRLSSSDLMNVRQRLYCQP